MLLVRLFIDMSDGLDHPMDVQRVDHLDQR